MVGRWPKKGGKHDLEAIWRWSEPSCTMGTKGRRLSVDNAAPVMPMDGRAWLQVSQVSMVPSTGTRTPERAGKWRFKEHAHDLQPVAAGDTALVKAPLDGRRPTRCPRRAVPSRRPARAALSRPSLATLQSRSGKLVFWWRQLAQICAFVDPRCKKAQQLFSLKPKK